MIESHACPRCHSTNTTMFTTVHPTDPLCFCMVCQHFWRPLEEADRRGKHEDPAAPTAPTGPAPSPRTDSDDGDA